MSNGHSRKCSEGVQSALNKADEALTRFRDRATLARPRFLKRYEEGNLHIHAHWRRVRADVEPEYFCTVYERDDGTRTGANHHLIDIYRVSTTRAETHAFKRDGPSDDMEEVMLISDIQSMQQPQWMQVNVACIGSRVWLQGMNDCHCAGSELSFFSGSRGLSADVLGGSWNGWYRMGISNGELNTSVWRPTVGDDELPGDVVKCRTKAMAQITDDQSDIIGRLLGDTGTPILKPRVRIVLDDNTIWVERSEFCEGDMQLIEVLLGPPDLRACAV